METCGICCDEFTCNDKIRVTQCNHIFHSKCLLQWVKHKINSTYSSTDPPDCPYCKWNLLEPKVQEITEDDQVLSPTKQNNHSARGYLREHSSIHFIQSNLREISNFHVNEVDPMSQPQVLPPSDNRA